MREISVLAIARPGDVHGDRVVAALLARGVTAARISLDTLRESAIDWRLGDGLNINPDGVITANSTVWWRRPGRVSTRDLWAEEGELIAAEGYDLLLGSLLATRPRWVDHPQIASLAENKLHQLATAAELGIAVPPTVVTNRPASAECLAANGPIVAKAVSAGWGLAPQTKEVPRHLFDKVSVAPVLLQSLMRSVADLRVVTIGGQVFIWRRPRGGSDPVDWRAADPTGDGFERVASNHAVTRQAIMLTERLGLSQSSQDWIEGPDGLVFLEANPGGQWLFLIGAEQTVLPALVDHLATQP